MFAAQRIKNIKEFLINNKSVDIATLTNMFEVSDVTIRKDLEKLEREGFLVKNHGGATIVEDAEPQPASEVMIENQEEKEQIAALACTLVEEGDSIFLGPGSTCYLFSKKLKYKKNITIVTNNVTALQELSPSMNKIVLIGGEISEKNGVMYSSGYSTTNPVKGMYVNKSFLSVDGVDLMAGFTVNDLSLSTIFKQIPVISKQTIFLTDYTKFDKIGCYQVTPIDFPHCVVSNERIRDTYTQFFYEKNIKVLTTFDI